MEPQSLSRACKASRKADCSRWKKEAAEMDHRRCYRGEPFDDDVFNHAKPGRKVCLGMRSLLRNPVGDESEPLIYGCSRPQSGAGFFVYGFLWYRASTVSI